MPEPSKIPVAFASSGDKNSIPQSSGTPGLASWSEGFPAITSTPFAQGGLAPKRADFNGIFNALSLAAMWQQQGGFYAYDSTTDYEVGNVVEYNGDLYKCLSANGPSSSVVDPTDTTVWDKCMTAADAAALYLPLSTIQTGTWTPSLKGGTTAGTFTYSAQTGGYIKIGKLVYIYGYVAPSACTDVPTGTVQIGGLPFSSASITSLSNRIMCIWGRASGLEDNALRKIVGFYVPNGNTVLVARVIIPNSTYTMDAYNDASWSASSVTNANIKITASSISGTGITLAGGYMAE